QFYLQSEGLPIGSCISPILAEIFLDSLEHKIFNSNNSLVKYVKHWFRYVDDVFCLFTGQILPPDRMKAGNYNR
ncbi:hypothetical protein, partial [Klebsiella pneumoniae]|uniref:hypothetical protein n=1 Tax=Klebsiella pneumoniae TaxID=573 RepID=UPI0040558ABD